jgi:hypothetical protein
MDQGLVNADLLTIFGDGTPNDPLNAASGLVTNQLQHFRVPFTIGAAEIADFQSTTLIPIPVPFSDALYTAIVSLELDDASVPAWLLNNVYAQGDIIFDPATSSLQQVTVAGTSGAVIPAFNPIAFGTTAEGPNTLVWTNVDVSLSEAYIQQKLAASLTFKCIVLLTGFTPNPPVPCIANVMVIHD